VVAACKRKKKRQKNIENKRLKGEKEKAQPLCHSRMGWYLSTWHNALKNAYYLYRSPLILHSYNAWLGLSLAPLFSVLAKEREVMLPCQPIINFEVYGLVSNCSGTYFFPNYYYSETLICSPMKH
jgi:hypothetical protein